MVPVTHSQTVLVTHSRTVPVTRSRMVLVVPVTHSRMVLAAVLPLAHQTVPDSLKYPVLVLHSRTAPCLLPVWHYRLAL